MGQKSNPIILRIGINRTWNSIWFADRDDYRRFLQEDLQIRAYVKKELTSFFIEKVKIERLHKRCVVTLFTSRPGVLIGKKGNDIDRFKKEMSAFCSSEISINVVEVKQPDLSASLVADGIARQLEKRVSYKKAMKRAIQSAMRMGAGGIKIMCSGRLAGAEIARSEYYKEGRIPLHTLRSDIAFATAEAYTAYGICGVKVWIYKKDVFSYQKSE